jgi:hypothetical protein
MLSDANIKAVDAELSWRHDQWGFSMFRPIPFIVSDLPEADLLYMMQISMLDHLQKWIFYLLKTHERLN